MREWINIINEAFGRGPAQYPIRQGNSVAAYMDFIVAAMRRLKYCQDNLGDRNVFPWRTMVGDEISAKTGKAALDRLVAKGILSYEIDVKLVTGLQRRGAYGRSLGMGGSRTDRTYVITPGPNFPDSE